MARTSFDPVRDFQPITAASQSAALIRRQIELVAKILKATGIRLSE